MSLLNPPCALLMNDPSSVLSIFQNSIGGQQSATERLQHSKSQKTISLLVLGQLNSQQISMALLCFLDPIYSAPSFLSNQFFFLFHLKDHKPRFEQCCVTKCLIQHPLSMTPSRHLRLTSNMPMFCEFSRFLFHSFIFYWQCIHLITISRVPL